MESQASKAPLKTALDLTHAQRFLNQVVKEERSEYAKVLEGTTPEGSFSWMWSRSARILWLVVSAPLFIFYIKSEPPISLVYLLGSLSCVYNSIYRIGAVSPKLANRIADAFNILCWLLLLTLPASWAALFYSTEDRSRGFWLALSMVTLTLITSMRGILAEQSIGSRRLRGMRVRVAISLHIITVFVVGATALLIASEWASSSGVEPPLPLITLIITTVIASAALTIRRRRKVFALAVVAVDSLLGELAVYDRNSLRVRELILATLSLERALRGGSRRALDVASSSARDRLLSQSTLKPRRAALRVSLAAGRGVPGRLEGVPRACVSRCSLGGRGN